MQATAMEVQAIPLSKIKPNPDNPRHVITQDMIDAMAASLKEVGLKNPVKVCPTPEGDYLLISGHIRLEGAKKLGWETLPSLVLNLTPEQALLEAILDNRGQEMTWLDLYQSAESLLKMSPDMTQEQIATQLEMNQATVSRGIRIMSVLSENARRTIYQNLISGTDYQISENAVFRLTELADIPTKSREDLQSLIHRTLIMAITMKMTEPQVAKLVAFVKNGGSPEGFAASEVAKQNTPDPSDPRQELWKSLPKNVRVTKSKVGYRVVMDLADSETPVAIYSAMAALEHLKANPLLGHSGQPTETVGEFEKALPAILSRARQEKAMEEAAQAKAQEERRAKTEAAKAKKAEYARSRRKAVSPPAAAPMVQTESSPTPQTEPQPVAVQLGPQTPEPPMEIPSTSSTPGILEGIKDKVGLSDGTLKNRITEALVNDAESAANSLVRQGMKKLFRGLLSQ